MLIGMQPRGLHVDEKTDLTWRNKQLIYDQDGKYIMHWLPELKEKVVKVYNNDKFSE